MVAFMGMLAVTVDLAQLRHERARAQGAADNVSAAAAYRYCESFKTKSAAQARADATAAGEALGTASAYTAAIQETSGRWTADIDTTVEGAFSRVFGVNELSAWVTATTSASCTTTTVLPAFYAGSTTCGEKTFEWSGSGSQVTGAVHSNDELKIGGNNTVTGQGSYVEKVIDPSETDWRPSAGNPSQTAVKAVPVTFDINDYAPVSLGGTRSSAPDYHWTPGIMDEAWFSTSGLYDPVKNTLTPGTYYAGGGFDFGSLEGTDGKVTLVTPGQVKFSASNVAFEAYEDNLLVFSDHHEPGKCDTFGIDISASNMRWAGVVYAPRSQIKDSGSGNRIDGSFLADTLSVSGSGWRIETTSVTRTTTQPRVVVVE